MNSFDQLRTALASWPTDLPCSPYPEACHDRLRKALLAWIRDRCSAGPGDLAGLVRHSLREESLRRGDPELFLRVPTAHGWPDRGTWSACGVEVARDLGDSLHVRATPWMPSWLGALPVGAAAEAGEQRRVDESCTADPAIGDLLGLPRYLSLGQQMAVRAAFVAPAGAVLLVNLPTGAGKSLVFQATAARAAEAGRMAIVVVPTTALARDQERRTRELLGALVDSVPSLAYHSGLTSEEKRAFRHRIREGRQPVVISSPEAVVGVLRRDLLMAAAQGRLATLTVDEAHIVSQWGQGFRPEFQLMAGLRETLVAASPPGSAPRTYLLTGTLTEEAAATLRVLYGPDEFSIVSDAKLRPEPDFWVYGADSEAGRVARVEEALRHLPRPLILYTTKRDAAAEWYSRVRRLGIRRAALVRGGDLTSSGGAQVMARWVNRETDIVVATSAFGLGVDQGDVRSVVHACIPETVDRFYQEVGRAGRDGRASVSLVVHTLADRDIARSLSRRRVIGIEKGLDRWRAMFQAGELVDGRADTYTVPLDARHPQIGEDSEANKDWNARTLTLMARAGLIALTTPPIPILDRLPDETEQEFENRWRNTLIQFGNLAAVHLINTQHATEEMWADRVESYRQESMATDERSLECMFAVLQGKTPISNIVRDVYAIEHLGVYPTGATGGCSVTRAQGRAPEASVASLPYAPATPDPPVSRRFLEALPQSGALRWVAYARAGSSTQRRQLWRRILSFAEASVEAGVLEIAASAKWMQDTGLRRLYQRSPTRFIVCRDVCEADGVRLDGRRTSLPLPRLSLLDPDTRQLPDHLFMLDRPLHVIVTPDHVPDVDRPDRSLMAVTDHISLDQVLARVEA